MNTPTHGRIKVLAVPGRDDVVELNVDGQSYYLDADKSVRLGETLLNAGVAARMHLLGLKSQEKRS